MEAAEVAGLDATESFVVKGGLVIGTAPNSSSNSSWTFKLKSLKLGEAENRLGIGVGVEVVIPWSLGFQLALLGGVSSEKLFAKRLTNELIDLLFR